LPARAAIFLGQCFLTREPPLRSVGGVLLVADRAHIEIHLSRASPCSKFAENWGFPTGRLRPWSKPIQIISSSDPFGSRSIAESWKDWGQSIAVAVFSCDSDDTHYRRVQLLLVVISALERGCLPGPNNPQTPHTRRTQCPAAVVSVARRPFKKPSLGPPRSRHRWNHRPIMAARWPSSRKLDWTSAPHVLVGARPKAQFAISPLEQGISNSPSPP